MVATTLRGTILLAACPCCEMPLAPVPDGESYRFARCLACGRTFFAELDASQTPSLDGAPESPAGLRTRLLA